MQLYPEYADDIFSDDGIENPYPHYAAIRSAGPVVKLQAQNVLAVGRYADVRHLLMDHRTFVSGEGIALDPMTNQMSRGTTIASDPPVHSTLRGLIGAPLQPQAVQELRAQIQQAADELIERLAMRGSFDGVADLARFLPVSIVSNLVGLPENGRQNMLAWAAAAFDCGGPSNERFDRALPLLNEMLAYTIEEIGPDRVKPGSWAARIFTAAADGVIAPEQVPALILDYLGPSLDTTIFATSHLLHLLGQHPEQWAMLRADATLIPNAIDEAVRLESPIRGFTRVAAGDCNVDGVPVTAGSRVLLLFASANRDDRKWQDPAAFLVTRDNARDHLGFGKGRHVCAGQHLARLEMQCLLHAMARRFESIDVGPAVIQPNNLLRGLAGLPVRVTTH